MKCFAIDITMSSNEFQKVKTIFIRAENKYDAGTCAIASECHHPAKFTDTDKQTIDDYSNITYMVDEVKEVSPQDQEVIEKYMTVFDYTPSWVEHVQPCDE